MAVAITDETAPKFPKLQPLWHRSAPRSVTGDSTADSTFGDWPAWQKHLAGRRRPELPTFRRGKEPAILWGWPDEWKRDEIQSSLASPDGSKAFESGFALAAPDLPLALQIVALAYALPQLAGELDAETWWRLAEGLHDLSVESQQHRVDWPADPRDVVRQQLLAGELPLALGCLFPEVRALRALRKGARAALSEALIELTDGEGLPHARLLPVLGPLFACWTRARWLGAGLDRGPWSRKADFQYQWLVRRAVRLADVDGRFLLTPRGQSTPAWTKALFATALDLAGDSGDCAAAAAALPRRVVPKRIRFNADDLPEPSLNSDWSGIAVLAGGWSRRDVRLAVAYADDPLQIELSAGGERLLAGAVTSDTTCDGAPVQIAGEWERLCWESGKRYDFLELGIDLTHGLRLERQLLLGRQDAVLYVADILYAADGAPRQLKHSLKLPLDDQAAWQPETETRDGLIVATRRGLAGHHRRDGRAESSEQSVPAPLSPDGSAIASKTRAAVLPLALHEWRADPRGGHLAEENGRLTLTQEARGRALCCPLLFDLDRQRAKKERTWRQLTIGESLEVVPPDVAVAFRAQSGRHQWLFYRSLGPPGNRTFLGQNVAGEFSAGPFLPTGKYKEWIEIEAV